MNFEYNESIRQSTLDSLDILETAPDWKFDCLTALASYVFGTPMSVISFVDHDRQWFKSKVGIDLDETPRGISFCHEAIKQQDAFVVYDATQDERFSRSPLVTQEPNIRFYAGTPIQVYGQNIGTLCVMDRVPHEVSHDQENGLLILSQIAAALILNSQEVQRLTDIIRSLSNELECLRNAA